MSIEVEQISKNFGELSILSKVSFTIKNGEKIGIVGLNGSGKTTLLKILAGVTPYEDGNVSLDKNATIGYIPQAPDYDPKSPIKEILLEMVQSHEEYKIDEVLKSLSIFECKEKLFGQLSSGQKTKLYLARIMVNNCQVLLLDEPTNHLDVESLELLENYLKNFKGTICVVSHDRAFLDRLVDKIFELKNGAIKIYGGNYSFYKEQNEIEREAQRNAYGSQQKNLKRLKTSSADTKQDAERTENNKKQTRDNDKYASHFFANRASNKKAAAAKAIETRIDSIDLLEKIDDDPKLKMLFTPKNLGPKTVAQVKDLHYKIDNTEILKGVSFSIDRGARIEISGPNGVGKTTLIKLLLGILKPTSGEIKIGESVELSYLSQEHDILDSSDTVLDELVNKADIDKTSAYRLLSWLLVPSEKMNKPVSVLSNGEQSKILLAEIIASGANFIILDEPTNHLDIPTREAIEAAIREYSGTLVVISHDRYFLKSINLNQKIEIKDGLIKHS